MGLISAFFKAQAPPATHDYWYTSLGQSSLTGIRIDAAGALSASPVWGCVNVLSSGVGVLPIITYRRRQDGGKDRAWDHPLYDVLHLKPNELQTPFAFKRMLMVHALLWGNGYARIVPGPRGPVDQLIPLHPDGVRVERLPGGGVRYMVRNERGTENAVNDEDIFHIPGLSLDGVSGLSIMDLARESIAINLAAKEYGARFFSESAQPRGYLKVAGQLKKEGRENLLEYWMSRQGGLRNVWKPAVLQDGVEWEATGMTNEDALLVATLEWSAADCARFFNVPLHMIQETSKVTSWGSGIAELSAGFVTWSLMPWLVNIQETISKDLIVANRLYFAEFLVDALLQAKTLERYQAYEIATGGKPWMTVNEVRVTENRNPISGGDELTAPTPQPVEPMIPEPSRNGRENGAAHAYAHT
jgi:HK97 family phage portal protein